MEDKPDVDLVYQAILHYGLEESKIVLAQAILETGYFRSRISREYNNLFGLFNSRTMDYYKFNHWSESVIGYRDYVQYRKKPEEEYYYFLWRIGYAEDRDYISKVQIIERRLSDER